MYCPQCGQRRASEETSFCSRCGYLLTGTADLLKTGGMAVRPEKGGPRSPRSKGIRTGLFLFLLMFLVAPIIGLILRFGFNMIPWPMGIVIFLLGAGGLLRIAYALLFESNDPYTADPSGRELRGKFVTASLPPQREVSAAEYLSPAGGWRETDVEAVTSVTENTTRLLEKDTE